MGRFRYVSIFFITCLIFFSGFFLAHWMDTQKVRLLESDNKELSEYIIFTDIDFFMHDIMGKNMSCDFLSLEVENLVKEADSLAEKMEQYQYSTQLGLNPEFEKLRRRYYLNRFKNWLYVKRLEEFCNKSTLIVLYFYNDSCKACPSEGFYISYYKKKDLENLNVFSFDKEADIPFLRLLLFEFNVTTVPSIVVDDELYEDFLNAQNMKSVFCNKEPSLVFCKLS